MKRLLALLIFAALLTACGTVGPNNQEPDPNPNPDPEPLTVTIRDYYGTNGNTTLVLVDIISNREVTLTVDAMCTLSRTGEPWTTLVGYEGRITVETLGSDRSVHWSNRGAPDARANRIQCNTLRATTSDGQDVTIRLR